MIDALAMNPFATRFTHPARCDFVMPPQWQRLGVSDYLRQPLDRFIKSGFLGQIVGPHGCGKSTLAIALSRQLWDRFSSAVTITIRNRFGDSDRNRYSVWPNATGVVSEPIFERVEPDVPTSRELVILDGCGVLSKLNQRLLVHSARKSPKAFLMTTHRAIRGVPLIASLRPGFQPFLEIVKSLQQDCPVNVAEHEISEAWSRSQGNYRAGLSCLYDRYYERAMDLDGVAAQANRDCT